MKTDNLVVATFDAIDLLTRLAATMPKLSRGENLLYCAAIHLADSIRSCTSFGQS